MLPGDEVIEKKHKNIKHLIAMERNEDLSRRETRTFPGLGANIFKIDFAKLFPDTYSVPSDETQISTTPETPIIQNEINTDVTVKNTPYHKHVIKARNDAYVSFRQHFEISVKRIMTKFDNDRKDEVRFNAYWQQNLKEITAKHI